MAHVDMDPKLLESYEGISPCPKDFDEFWDKSVKEMRNCDPKTEFIEADFKCNNADCFDMFFIAPDGAKIHAKHVRPKNIKGKIPAILWFHGAGDSSGTWSDKLKFINEGFAVFALDVRGQGGISEDIGGVSGNTMRGHFMRGVMDKKPEKLFYRNVFLDVAQLAEIVFSLDFVDEDNVSVYGGSQGGALSIVCASLQPKIKKAGILYPYLCDFKRVWNLRLNPTAYTDLFDYFRMYDPAHEREDEVFELLGYIDIVNLAKRVKAEVFMSTGLMDITCPPSTQFAMYNKLTCKKKYILYPEYGHEFIGDAYDRIFMFLTN